MLNVVMLSVVAPSSATEKKKTLNGAGTRRYPGCGAAGRWASPWLAPSPDSSSIWKDSSPALRRNPCFKTFLNSLRVKLEQGTLTEGESFSTVDFLVLTCLDQLPFKVKILFTFFNKTNHLNEEVRRTEPSPSISIPWLECFTLGNKLYISARLTIEGHL